MELLNLDLNVLKRSQILNKPHQSRMKWWRWHVSEGVFRCSHFIFCFSCLNKQPADTCLAPGSTGKQTLAWQGWKVSRRLKAAGSQECLTGALETHEIKQGDKMCLMAAAKKGMTRHDKTHIYYLHILQAFGAANQQLVVGSQALPVKLSQQYHLQNNRQRQKWVFQKSKFHSWWQTSGKNA